jgi:DNA-binding CsgD family transcriptional regulator
MLIREDIAQNARAMSAACDVDSALVFICDKTNPRTQLYFLGNFGVSEDILSRYQRYGICDVDPFTDVETSEALVGGGFRAANDSLVHHSESKSRPYWEFTSQFGVDVVGAGTMRLSSRLYLTVGIHRHRERSHNGSVPLDRLAHSVNELQNSIAANLLSLLLDSGSGYRTLLASVAAKSATSVPERCSLTPREAEVARLVCQGKLNKQIAWMAGISEHTVENHLRRIYKKLNIHNRASLVAVANEQLA